MSETPDWTRPVVGDPEDLREHIPEDIAEDYEAFDIHGAGLVFFSKTARNRCRHASGFSFMDSCGTHGLAGGVMDAQEAKRLANHIYAALAKLEAESNDD